MNIFNRVDWSTLRNPEDVYKADGLGKSEQRELSLIGRMFMRMDKALDKLADKLDKPTDKLADKVEKVTDKLYDLIMYKQAAREAERIKQLDDEMDEMIASMRSKNNG